METFDNQLKNFRTRYLTLAAVLCGLISAVAAQAPMLPEEVVQVTDKVYVIPDQRVNLVPNAGIVLGEKGVLVVDTGMGPKNAEIVLKQVRSLTAKPVRYLTITHFHPEHGMGAQSFPAETTIIYPAAQKEELIEKGPSFIEMFREFGPGVAGLLEPVRIVHPDVVFSEEAEIDLGDTRVQLFHWGAAHTRGDNFVFLPEEGVLFAGDIVVDRFFPILPDPDANGNNWLHILERLKELSPKFIVPGHGKVGDVSLITELQKYFTLVKNRVQDLSRQGKSATQIEQTLGPEIRSRYSDWDNPEWIKNVIENFYARLEQE